MEFMSPLTMVWLGVLCVPCWATSAAVNVPVIVPDVPASAGIVNGTTTPPDSVEVPTWIWPAEGFEVIPLNVTVYETAVPPSRTVYVAFPAPFGFGVRAVGTSFALFIVAVKLLAGADDPPHATRPMAAASDAVFIGLSSGCGPT